MYPTTNPDQTRRQSLDVDVDIEDCDVRELFSQLLGVSPETLDPEELSQFSGMSTAEVMEQIVSMIPAACVDQYYRAVFLGGDVTMSAMKVMSSKLRGVPVDVAEVTFRPLLAPNPAHIAT